MPFLVINKANIYDARNFEPISTREKADVKARELLEVAPASQILITEILATYSAVVSVTVADPEPVVEEEEPPVEEEPQE